MNATLIWNFTLSGDPLRRVEISLGITQIGERDSSGAAVFDTNNFKQRFDISADEPATLIVLNVTEAEEGEYICAVLTRASKFWRDKIMVEVVGT